MRLVTFSTPSDPTRRLGVLLTNTAVVDLARVLEGTVAVPASLGDYIAAGSQLHQAVRNHLERNRDRLAAAAHDLGSVALRTPFRPGKIVGVGLNYAEHVDESSRSLDTDRVIPERPVLFSKPATAVIGPGEAILHNAALTRQLDWECELAVVIGATARRVKAENAYDHIFGYSIMNDISARDQRRSGQWFFSKGQDSYAPFGPMIVTADEIPDPHSLTLTLTVNGERRQNGNSKQMIFQIPRLIEEISSGITLEPGDVIATGSPSGVGAAMNPPTFLKPGDVVSCSIEGIGMLTNPVEAVAP